MQQVVRHTECDYVGVIAGFETRTQTHAAAKATATEGGPPLERRFTQPFYYILPGICTLNVY
jgi:Hemimethylated DNA-binding protein YccV like